MATLTAAEEAAQHSAAHQEWILQTLVNNGGACSYGTLVEVGEEHQCDTVGAMLKILKNRKKISFKPMFLMFPMHKDEVVQLLPSDGDDANAGTGTTGTATTSEPNLEDLRLAEEAAQRQRTAAEASARPKHVFKKKPVSTIQLEEDSDDDEDVKVVHVEEAKPATSPAAVDSNGTFYALDKLTAPGPYPSGVDPAKREQYLEDAAFQTVFSMAKPAFFALPNWKQQALKKKARLF